MPLTPGTRLGAYEVSAPIGAGGMGEVYRARDTRLGRFVAVKVLPAKVASDPNRRKRFEREARAVAALCHPHICTVFDVGREETPSGPCDYLVMELLEGESLAERLRSGPLPIDQLLKAGIELASALHSAHRAGVVHRDVKPANMVLTKTGAKLLDFGVARLQSVGTPADGEGAGVTETLDPLTDAGQAMGTYPYMAPEQLEGLSVDARADLFALGAVLYEMATGRRAFPGTSPSSIAAAILTTDPPPIGSLRSVVPRSLDRLVRTLLARDPDERVQSAHDVVLRLREIAEDSGGALPAAAQGARQAGELQEIKEDSDSEAVASAAPAGRDGRRWLGAPVMAALILAAAAGAVTIAGRQWRGRVADTARRSSTSVIRVEKLTSRGNASAPAISPDGRYLVYTSREEGRSEIWLRDVGEKTETRLVDPIDSEDPSFGPHATIRFAKDGQAVCFELTPKGSGRPHLYRVPLIGGKPRLIRADARIDQLSPDLKLLAFTHRQDDKTVLVIADAESGQEKEVGEVARVLAWSPDGSRLLFSRVKDGTHTLFLVSADGTGERKVADLAQAPSHVWWKPGGDGILWALQKGEREVQLLELDPVSRATRPLGDRIWRHVHALHWLPNASGFVVNELAGPRNALWFVSYPEGSVERVPAGPHDYWGLGMTADGTKLVSVEMTQRSELLVASDPEKGAFRKIASGTDVQYRFCWTIDGTIVYSSNEGGSYDLYVADADGLGRRQLTFDRISNETEPAAGPDGRYIVFVSNRKGESGLHRINLDGTGLKSLTGAPTNRPDRDPQFTPDSKWVLYQHWDRGPTLRKIPIDGGTPVLINGARPPVPPALVEWAYGASVSPDGGLLAFLSFTKDPEAGASATDVVVASLDGQVVKRFPYRADKTGTVRGDSRVQWSRDGSALYYDLNGLWKRPLAGASLAQVTHFEEPLGYFDWSFDGKTLACSRTSGQSDVVMITNFH